MYDTVLVFILECHKIDEDCKSRESPMVIPPRFFLLPDIHPTIAMLQ